MSIRIYYDNIAYRLRKSRHIIQIIKEVIMYEEKTTGDLCFIITNDRELVKINQEFLGRNKLTDVIAFDYGTNREVSGEIYISIDSVRRNANNYKVSLRNEVLRVMIHGTLHLCGYLDGTEKEKEKIRKNEDKWLEVIYRTK